jgi:hypothetical protein
VISGIADVDGTAGHRPYCYYAGLGAAARPRACFATLSWAREHERRASCSCPPGQTRWDASGRIRSRARTPDGASAPDVLAAEVAVTRFVPGTHRLAHLGRRCQSAGLKTGVPGITDVCPWSFEEIIADDFPPDLGGAASAQTAPQPCHPQH